MFEAGCHHQRGREREIERDRDRDRERERERESSPGFDEELRDGAAMPLLGHCLYLVLARLALIMTHCGCLLDSNTVALREVSSLDRDYDLGSQWGRVTIHRL